jgi:hypothetical protein
VDNRRQCETDQLTYTLSWQGAVTQEGSMAYSTKLPSRFPVGTKFVIEGNGKIYSRYLEFPDGTFFPLPARPVPAELKPKAPISRRLSARRRS